MQRLLFLSTVLNAIVIGQVYGQGVNLNVGGQIHRLGVDVKSALQSDPRFRHATLSLGRFIGEGEADKSSFGLRVEQQLREELKEVLKEKGSHTLAGSYHFVRSNETSNTKVLLVTAQIKDDRGQQISSISVEVNDSDEIMQALGLTGAVPNKEFKERNDVVQNAVENPEFDVDSKDKHRVTAKGLPLWSVAIKKKPTFDGPSDIAFPENVKGQAFVKINLDEYYEIELVNNDKADAVVTLTVDGLDVANTFSIDKNREGEKIKWPGYLVPAGQKFLIRGWLKTINSNAGDNVLSFHVKKLGEGAASKLNVVSSIGVITAQFREATVPDSKLSARSFGETATGEALQQKLEAKPVKIGNNVLSTISIRYNRPE